MEFPVRNKVYKGPILDSSRWDSVQLQAGDVIVATPEKSGTTWTQAIVAMLILGDADLQRPVSEMCHWLDSSVVPLEEILAVLDGQSHRRMLKTHTPLDGLPYDKSCTYLCVFRDPRDMYFSMRNHVMNLNGGGAYGAEFPEDFATGFRAWVAGRTSPENFGALSLERLSLQYKTFADFADLPNIHVFHYADMKRDLLGSVRQMSLAMGLEHSEAFLQQVAAAADFSAMKKNSDVFVPFAGRGRWKDDSKFFRAGKAKQWAEMLSSEELAAYDQRMTELFTPTQVKWLENGSV